MSGLDQRRSYYPTQSCSKTLLCMQSLPHNTRWGPSSLCCCSKSAGYTTTATGLKVLSFGSAVSNLATSSLSTVSLSHCHQFTKQVLPPEFASFVIFLPSSILTVFVEQIQKNISSQLLSRGLTAGPAAERRMPP